ncbi:PH domain-containing protein [Entamoeba marina]
MDITVPVFTSPEITKFTLSPLSDKERNLIVKINDLIHGSSSEVERGYSLLNEGVSRSSFVDLIMKINPTLFMSPLQSPPAKDYITTTNAVIRNSFIKNLLGPKTQTILSLRMVLNNKELMNTHSNALFLLDKLPLDSSMLELIEPLCKHIVTPNSEIAIRALKKIISNNSRNLVVKSMANSNIFKHCHTILVNETTKIKLLMSNILVYVSYVDDEQVVLFDEGLVPHILMMLNEDDKRVVSSILLLLESLSQNTVNITEFAGFGLSSHLKKIIEKYPSETESKRLITALSILLNVSGDESFLPELLMHKFDELLKNLLNAPDLNKRIVDPATQVKNRRVVNVYHFHSKFLDSDSKLKDLYQQRIKQLNDIQQKFVFDYSNSLSIDQLTVSDFSSLNVEVFLNVNEAIDNCESLFPTQYLQYIDDFVAGFLEPLSAIRPENELRSKFNNIQGIQTIIATIQESVSMESKFESLLDAYLNAITANIFYKTYAYFKTSHNRNTYQFSHEVEEILNVYEKNNIHMKDLMSIISYHTDALHSYFNTIAITHKFSNLQSKAQLCKEKFAVGEDVLCFSYLTIDSDLSSEIQRHDQVLLQQKGLTWTIMVMNQEFLLFLTRTDTSYSLLQQYYLSKKNNRMIFSYGEEGFEVIFPTEECLYAWKKLFNEKAKKPII